MPPRARLRALHARGRRRSRRAAQAPVFWVPERCWESNRAGPGGGGRPNASSGAIWGRGVGGKGRRVRVVGASAASIRSGPAPRGAAGVWPGRGARRPAGRSPACGAQRALRRASARPAARVGGAARPPRAAGRSRLPCGCGAFAAQRRPPPRPGSPCAVQVGARGRGARMGPPGAQWRASSRLFAAAAARFAAGAGLPEPRNGHRARRRRGPARIKGAHPMLTTAWCPFAPARGLPLARVPTRSPPSSGARATRRLTSRDVSDGQSSKQRYLPHPPDTNRQPSPGLGPLATTMLLQGRTPAGGGLLAAPVDAERSRRAPLAVPPHPGRGRAQSKGGTVRACTRPLQGGAARGRGTASTALRLRSAARPAAKAGTW
jgi:hypothetical protein